MTTPTMMAMMIRRMRMTATTIPITASVARPAEKGSCCNAIKKTPSYVRFNQKLAAPGY